MRRIVVLLASLCLLATALPSTAQAVSAPPEILSVSFSPSSVVFTNAESQDVTVTMITSRPISLGWATLHSPGDDSDDVFWDNPSGDGVTWTDTLTFYDFDMRGTWTMGDYEMSWYDDNGVDDDYNSLQLVSGPATTITLASPPKKRAVNKAVKISNYRFDSPGKDTRTNSSLNGEWVQLTNTSRTAVALTGYTLRDAQNHVYTFGPTVLAGGKKLTVYTGNGKASASKRYWGSGNYVWNNDGDTAQLRDSYNRVVSTVTWNAHLTKKHPRKPHTSSPSHPAGATAQCRDGSFSYSQHRSGTCSHHGGVAVWFLASSSVPAPALPCRRWNGPVAGGPGTPRISGVLPRARPHGHGDRRAGTPVLDHRCKEHHGFQ